MKLIGSLLVTVSLIIGVLAATTAYLVPIDRIDPDQDRVVLHAPAGSEVDEDDPTAMPEPVLRPGTMEEPLTLTEAHLDELRDAGATRVHAKEFSFRHWQEWWLFLLACIGLTVGSLMVRTAMKRELTQLAPSPSEQSTVPPRELLENAKKDAVDLQNELSKMTDPRAKQQRILSRVERMQEQSFDPFVQSRPKLINDYGMAGYAQIMDRFAAAERQFNRAWSAAADHVLEEADVSIAQGITILDEAMERLAQQGK
ncbi:MAG: hypothetical protein EA377_05600 [Phycisphaerales bacterium]|nr:MAG: hypothetical protein EA377_05600 [Phycisphaerales bacterium]